MNRKRSSRCPWLSFLLFPLIALVTATALGTAVLSWLTTRAFWVSSLSSDAYVEAIQGAIEQRLESECLFYGLDYNLIKGTPDTEETRSFCQAYAGCLYDAVREGRDCDSVSVSADFFRPGIDAFFTSLGKAGETVDDATRQEIGEALAKETLSAVQAFPSSSLLSSLHRYTFGHPFFSALLGAPPWLCLILAVLLAILLCWGAADLLSAAGSAWGALWCGAAVWFVPFTVFWQNRLPEKLALDGELKYFAAAALNGVLNRGELLFFLAFGVASVGLIATFVGRLIRQRRRFDEAAARDS